MNIENKKLYQEQLPPLTMKDGRTYHPTIQRGNFEIAHSEFKQPEGQPKHTITLFELKNKIRQHVRAYAVVGAEEVDRIIADFEAKIARATERQKSGQAASIKKSSNIGIFR